MSTTQLSAITTAAFFQEMQKLADESLAPREPELPKPWQTAVARELVYSFPTTVLGASVGHNMSLGGTPKQRLMASLAGGAAGGAFGHVVGMHAPKSEDVARSKALEALKDPEKERKLRASQGLDWKDLAVAGAHQVIPTLPALSRAGSLRMKHDAASVAARQTAGNMARGSLIVGAVGTLAGGIMKKHERAMALHELNRARANISESSEARLQALHNRIKELETRAVGTPPVESAPL